MMFIFGADIKTAGTASIVISICVVTSGLWRYWRLGTIETRLGARRIVSAMSAGSLIGAALGGIAVGFAPGVVIKDLLGCGFIAAAAKGAVSKHLTKYLARAHKRRWSRPSRRARKGSRSGWRCATFLNKRR